MRVRGREYLLKAVETDAKDVDMDKIFDELIYLQNDQSLNERMGLYVLKDGLLIPPPEERDELTSDEITAEYNSRMAGLGLLIKMDMTHEQRKRLHPVSWKWGTAILDAKLALQEKLPTGGPWREPTARAGVAINTLEVGRVFRHEGNENESKMLGNYTTYYP